jgi:fumarylacetoacetate (FAA) hydrolase family protein
VVIAAARMGALGNVVQPTAACAPWTFGAGALMRSLARRGLLGGAEAAG